MYKKYNQTNNAKSLLKTAIPSWAWTILITDWEGALFPTSNFKIVLEKFNTAWQVTKREVVDIASRSTDTLTVWTRASEECVQDDTASPKTQAQSALSFDAWDQISIYFTWDTFSDVQDEATRLETDKLDKSTYNQERNVYEASSQWDDDYQITDSTITAYQEGQPIRFKCDVANAWAATLEINSLWAKALKKNQWTEDLITGDILANWIVTAFYNASLNVFQFSWQIATEVVPEVLPYEFWDWSDWALNITSWTTNLNTDQIYNYSSINISAWAKLSTAATSWIMKLKCTWTVTIDWEIDLQWKWWSAITSSVLAETVSVWSAWNAWNWGGWGWLYWWNWGTQGIGYWGWWGWWGSNSSLDAEGWDWWNWGTPWGTWGIWWSWWADWGNWGTSAWWGWGSAGGASWAWGDAYWNNWNNAPTANASGWGWAWGSKWENGWSIIILANNFGGTWTVNVSWWIWNSWGAWWSANPSSWNTHANWWGWGWGWGWGAWGAAILIANSSVFTWTITAGWGTWWSWGAWGSWEYNWTSWTSWTSWGTWNYLNKKITDNSQV